MPESTPTMYKHIGTAQCFGFLLHTLLITVMLKLFLYSTETEAEPTPVLDYRFSAIEAIELEKIGVQKSITQDQQGFMWFGGSNGLARFDGYKVTIFRHDPSDAQSLSYNEITCMLTDSRGRLWIGTTNGLNLYNKKTGGFIHYRKENRPPFNIPGNAIKEIVEDHRGHLWIATKGSGLIKLDETGPVAITPHIQSRTSPIDFDQATIRAMIIGHQRVLWLALEGQGLVTLDPESLQVSYANDTSGVTRIAAINELTVGPNGSIWIGTSNRGLLHLNPQTGELNQFDHTQSDANSLHHNTVWDLFFDQNGALWVATDDALDLFNPETDSFTHFPRLTGTELYGKVRALFQSPSGHFWLGMFPSGTAYLDIDATVFRNFHADQKSRTSLVHNAVSSIVEDRNGNYWIGTEGGLDYFDVKSQTIKHYTHDESDPYSLPSDSVLSLLVDSTKTLWVGTWKGGWARFDEKTERFHPAKMADGSQDHMLAEVWSIYEDQYKQLWVDGLYLYDREKDVFNHYRHIYPNGDTLSSDRVKLMYEDSQGVFWLGTAAGLDQLNRKTGQVTRFKHENDTPGSLSDHYVLSALEDSAGQLWFGTLAGGLNRFDRATSRFSSLRTSLGLPDDSIAGMIDDRNGSLWMISGSGLIRYRQDSQQFDLYDRTNGLSGDLFHRNAILLSRHGEIVFGGANGLTILNPNELTKNTTPPPVVLTDLHILNKRVTPSPTSKILTQPINFASQIHLDYTDNVFSIDFSALNYRLPNQNQYAYKLDGFDESWNHVGHARRATYTNLDPGDYQFHVRASNNSGVWNNQGVAIGVRIVPPWWQTTQAYALYAVLIIVLSGFAYTILRKLRQAKNERLINAQLRQVDQMKDAFLANTSHELRTPLNGIIGLTESIIVAEQGRLYPSSLDKLRVVVSSSKRLSNIINDILDFSKLRNHEIELLKKPVNFHDLVQTTLTLSEFLIDQKDIKMINVVNKDFPNFIADEQRLSQILFNLIGNAVKFTRQGHVKVSAEIIEHTVKIKVQDTGIGITAEDCNRIFLPFEQALTSAQGKSIGTGLGLAVTKKLIELHDGHIDVESQVGQGSTFIISLPYLSTDEIPEPPIASNIEKSQRQTSNIAILSQRKLEHHAKQEDDLGHVHILIVDDEPVNRMVLEGYLSIRHYTISECSTGKEALEKIAQGNRYDMVLLDIMMPGISGYEVCQAIRKSFNLLELPILLLTAKSQVEDMAMGYDAGANDFLFKPVVKEELLAKISMHMQSVNVYRKLLKEMKYSPPVH